MDYPKGINRKRGLNRLKLFSTKNTHRSKPLIAILQLIAEKGWQRFKGFDKLALAAKDIKFENGVLKEVA